MRFTGYSSRNLRGRSPNYVGLDYFKRILTNDLGIANSNFWRLLLFNVTWTLANVVLHVVIGVAVALLLNRGAIIGKRFFRACYIFPWAMPPLVVAVVWRDMFDPQFGAINLLLGSLHLPQHTQRLTLNHNPIPFLPFPPIAHYAVLLVNV